MQARNTQRAALVKRIEALTIPDDDTLSKFGRAFQENGALLVRWAPETRSLLVMEFIAQNDLYPKLNEFLKGKIR